MDIRKFFKQQKVASKVFVSSRFLDDDGNKIPFEILPILQSENEILKEQCQKLVDDKLVFDDKLYSAKLVCACVVSPDLNNAELQQNYGVLGREKLIKSMLLAGEFSNLIKAVENACGFNEEIDIKKIKN